MRRGRGGGGGAEKGEGLKGVKEVNGLAEG